MNNAAAKIHRSAADTFKFMLVAARRIYVFMIIALRRINGGDSVRHGRRRREAGTLIYKYIRIGSGVTQAPLPLPYIYLRAKDVK